MPSAAAGSAIIRASWPPPMTATTGRESVGGRDRRELSADGALSRAGEPSSGWRRGRPAGSVSKRRPRPRIVVIRCGRRAVVAELAADPPEVDVDGLRRRPERRVPHLRISSSRVTISPALAISAWSRSNSLRENTTSLARRRHTRRGLTGSTPDVLDLVARPQRRKASAPGDEVGIRPIGHLGADGLRESRAGATRLSGDGRRPARRARSRAPGGPGAAGSRTGRRAAARRWRRR